MESASTAVTRKELGRRLEETMVWGAQRGWEILGSPVNIVFTANDLGFTHSAEYGEAVTVYVNPTVLLEEQGERYLRGLILHEIGHHLAHFRDPSYRRVDREAKEARLKGLMNLIMDEHLERRLRSMDASWGEAFDALASWVFKGQSLDLNLEEYRALLGYPSTEEAAAAIQGGAAPGKVKVLEQGFCVSPDLVDERAANLFRHQVEIEGRPHHWISFPDFIRSIFAETAANRQQEILPTDLRREMESVIGQCEHLREVGGLADDFLLSHRALRIDDDARPRVARVTVAEVLQKWADGGAHERYIRRVKQILKHLFDKLPKLQRFIDELEVARGSKWFWSKQRSMLHNMRRGYDFRYAFLCTAEMGAEEFRELFGEEELLHPGYVLRQRLDQWKPMVAENPRLPRRISVGWIEILQGPKVAPLARFTVALRLGLGKTGVAGDEAAEIALRAIPRNLRKLDAWGLLDICRAVADTFGEEALDPKGREEAKKGEETGEPGQAGEGASGEAPSTGSERGAAGTETVEHAEEPGDEGREAGEEVGEPEEVIERGVDREQSGAGAGSAKPGQESGATSTIEHLLRSNRRQMDHLRNPRTKPTSKECRAIRSAARAAETRIEHWLRTGIEEAAEAHELESVKKGRKPKGVRQIAQRPGARASRSSGGGSISDHDVMNIAATFDFNPIVQVARVVPKRQEYARLARAVAKQTRSFRRYLSNLGEQELEVHGHKQGSRIDLSLARRLALFGDPAIMVGRESLPAPDLYFGIVIDCSGSMGFEDRMDKAKSFAILLLETARRLPGIDAHALGFTDDIIFDLGGPGDASVAALEPSGGNNDAAGLLHAAKLALKSPKTRKVVVMISDGHPTECSVDSLARLVQHLEARYQIVCAQVAVAELHQNWIAFPNYTDLSEHSLDGAVAAFGRMLKRLVMRRFGL